MRKINLFIIFIIIAVSANAQQDMNAVKKRMEDSIRAVHIDKAALKYPIIRQFSISHEDASEGTINSKLHDKDFFEGRLRQSRTIVKLNVPVIARKNNTLVFNFGVIQQNLSLNQVHGYNTQQIVNDRNIDMTTLSSGISYNHRDSLFGLPVSYTVSVNGLFDPSFSRYRFTYTGLVAFTLLRNKQTSLTAGFFLIRDPASPIPVSPFLSYSHHFQSVGVDLMIDLPYRIALRKEMGRRASLTAFGELEGNNFFRNINNSSLPQQVIYSSLTFKSGLLFEYCLSKKIVFSLSGGLQSTITSKLVDQNDKPGNYFIKNNNGMVPYLKVGISVLPIMKSIL